MMVSIRTIAFAFALFAKLTVSLNIRFSKIGVLRNKFCRYIQAISIENPLVTNSVEENNANYTSKSNLKKVRQHVNPLSLKYQEAVDLPVNWVNSAFDKTSFDNDTIIVDIGCSKGSWVINNALNNPMIHYLGMEIRRPVVELALKRKSHYNIKNAHFIATNANIDIQRILNDLKEAGLQIKMITIQFPDPHFKLRHKKRRVVNESLVNTIACNMSPQSRVFLQSDVLELMIDMFNVFLKHGKYEVVEGYNSENFELNSSPFSVQTEREIATLKKGQPVYRILLKVKD